MISVKNKPVVGMGLVVLVLIALNAVAWSYRSTIKHALLQSEEQISWINNRLQRPPSSYLIYRGDSNTINNVTEKTAIIEREAKLAKLDDELKEIINKAELIELHFQRVDFNSLMLLLVALEEERLSVQELQLESTTDSGTVSGLVVVL